MKNTTLCPTCNRPLPRTTEEKRKARIKASLDYQARHKAAGLCAKCPRPADGKRYCSRHKRLENARQNAIYHLKKGGNR